MREKGFKSGSTRIPSEWRGYLLLIMVEAWSMLATGCRALDAAESTGDAAISRDQDDGYENHYDPDSLIFA